MAQSIQCPKCGVALNLPAQALGRRLKCPKCAERFIPGGDGSSPPSGSMISSSPQDNPGSTLELTKKYSSADLPVMPTSAGDLRETFDLPLMTEAAVGSGKGGSANHSTKATGDALALFEDKPAEPRRKRGAEARATHRRCPTCGGYVPQGMSLCQTCGLDLDTGTKIDLDEDIGPTGPVRPQGIPLPVAIVGGICMAISVALTVATLGFWMKGTEGTQYFIPIGAFGIYASTQFLRLKNAKLLLIALSLGALIAVAGLIVLPIYNANAVTSAQAVTPVEDDPDAADVKIQSVEERLDMDKIKTGFAVLALYALITIYIISPQVQKSFRK